MADPTETDQRPGHLFKPGQSGNPAGRPKGSRSKLGDDFLKLLAEDFQANGLEAIQRTRETKPEVYVKVVASLLPKQIEVKEGAFDGVSDEDLAAIVAAARGALGVVARKDDSQTIQ